MRTEEITSRRNPLLQQVKKLLSSRKERYEKRLFVGDGTKLLAEAAAWCPGLETVILSNHLPMPELPAHVAVYRVPEDVMASVSPMEAPQGAVFLCRMPEESSAEVVPGCLVLEGIQDPGNLGTILRTADALGVSVILADGCADPYNWKTVRASMGAVFRREIKVMGSLRVAEECDKKGIPLAVTALAPDARDIRQGDLNRCAVVIGSEGRGVSPLLLERAGEKLIIPMEPRCESLNAASAATIVMWQMKLDRKE